jgi:hypothetical protein
MSWKLSVPTLATTAPTTSNGIQPAPTVAYSNMSELVYVVAARSSLAERKDLFAYAKNLASHATLQDLVWNLTAIY